LSGVPVSSVERPHADALRDRAVAVLPGGCSGFRYSLNIEQQPAADDVVIESAGVRLFVDEFSAQYINGTVIDFKSNFQESGFAFENPNASGGCGCGSSFTV